MALPTRVQRALQSADPLDLLHRDFEGMLSRFLGGRENNGAASGGYLAPYGVDVREDGDHIYVDAELPGFRKEEVDVTLENQTLTISAERSDDKKESADKGGDYLLRERRYNRFVRSFTLPPTVDEQHCEAKLQDGVLRITLNKREETKPRKVSVS